MVLHALELLYDDVIRRLFSDQPWTAILMRLQHLDN